MNDPQLHDELERRSGKSNVNRDWARRELLPAVSAAIETRPQKVATSRGPAFAGLAGAAAMLLILVVALPRFSSAPSATDQTSDRPPGTSAPDPIQPQILTAQEFAVGVLTGRLRSSTVLVDGTIGERPFTARGCDPPPDALCLMGRLEGTDPSVDVTARWLAVEEEDSLIIGRRAGTWMWWHHPSGPITGTLLLSVDGDGVIEFLGQVDAANSGEATTVAEATQVDIESVDLDDVVLVEGWLWSSGVTGEEVHISCLSPEFSPPPGLPNDSCSRTGRDAVVDYRNNVASSLTAPEPRLHVQRGAAAEYQGTVGDQPHVFAVAPRLYGGACEGAPPCWKWEVVGRLSGAEEPPSEPSSPPVREIGCTLPPGSGVPYVNGSWLAPSIIDQIGIVALCRVVEPAPLDPFPNPISVHNPDGDERVVEVTWSGTPCDAAVQFTLSRDFNGVHLDGTRPTIRRVGCDSSLVAHRLQIFLTELFPAQSITATIGEPEPTQSPAAVATPDVAPPPADAFIECTQPVAEFGAVVIDPTGLVDSCVTVEATGERVAESAVVRNPDGELTALQIEWPGSPCAAAVGFTFAPGPTGLAVEMGTRPDGKTLGSEINGTLVCVQPLLIHAIRLELNSRVDAGNVWITPTVVPTTSLRTLSCDESQFSVKDATGTILSCRGTAAEDQPDGNPLITNPDGDTNRLRVTWMIQDPAACGPQPPAVSLVFSKASEPPRFVVSTAFDFAPATGCFDVARSFALDLDLSEAIPASDVAFATSGYLYVATAVTESGIFDLIIDADRPDYRTDEPIEIEATLQYQGRETALELWGVTSLINGFGIKQLDGPLVMGPGWDAPCIRHQVRDGERIAQPFVKGASWAENDPNAAFYREWADDPVLRLPAGTWLATAYSEFAIGSDCAGPLVSLQASLLIVVR